MRFGEIEPAKFMPAEIDGSMTELYGRPIHDETKARIDALACAGDSVVNTMADNFAVIAQSEIGINQREALSSLLRRINTGVAETERLIITGPNQTRKDNFTNMKILLETDLATDDYLSKLILGVSNNLDTIGEVDQKQLANVLTGTINPGTINMIKSPLKRCETYQYVATSISDKLPEDQDGGPNTLELMLNYGINSLSGESPVNKTKEAYNIASIACFSGLEDKTVVRYLQQSYITSFLTYLPEEKSYALESIDGSLVAQAQTPQGALDIAGLISNLTANLVEKSGSLTLNELVALHNVTKLNLLRQSGVHLESKVVQEEQEKIRKGLYEDLQEITLEDSRILINSINSIYPERLCGSFLFGPIWLNGLEIEARLVNITSERMRFLTEEVFAIEDPNISAQDKRLLIYNFVDQFNPGLEKTFLADGASNADFTDLYSRKVFRKQYEHLLEESKQQK